MTTLRLYDFNVYNEKPRQGDDEEEQGQEVKISKKDDAVFSIQMFGISELGQTFSIIATDFEPFFYIKVGDDWTEETKRAFVSHIKSSRAIITATKTTLFHFFIIIFFVQSLLLL